MTRIATITQTAGLGPDRPVYLITYTKDGVDAGKSLARGDQLDDWKRDLLAAGWTIEEPS